jgi:predicted DNA binding protein
MIIDTLLYSSHLISSNNPTITALILGGIGAICSVFGAILYDRHKKLIKRGIQVQGTVISIESEKSNKDSMVINYAVIRYETLQSEFITKQHNIGISSNYSYKEGDSVNVIYDPDDNSLFTLNDTSSKNTPLTFILLGLALLAASIIIFIVKAG